MTDPQRRTRYAVETFWQSPRGLRPRLIVEAISYPAAIAQAAAAAQRSAGARALAFLSEFDDCPEPCIIASFGDVPEPT